MSDLHVIVEHRDDGAVTLRVTGELDLGSAPTLKKALEKAEDQNPQSVVLDLSQLTFMDSTGIRAILQARARATAAGRRLALVPGPPNVQEIFAVTGLDKHLTFIDSPGFPANAT